MQNTPDATPFPPAAFVPLAPELPDAAPVAARMTDAFGRLNLRLRARVLGRLLASVGSLALAVVSGGAFAKYITQANLSEIAVSFDDAARATSAQVYDLARYVAQSDPQLIERLLEEVVRFCNLSADPAAG